jgi:hypothetical protein
LRAEPAADIGQGNAAPIAHKKRYAETFLERTNLP